MGVPTAAARAANSHDENLSYAWAVWVYVCVYFRTIIKYNIYINRC